MNSSLFAELPISLVFSKVRIAPVQTPLIKQLFTQVPRRISMKMSSRRASLERSSVTQHRPQHVHPPSSQRDQSLSVPLTFSSLALVEGSGLRSAAQAGKG